MNHHLPDQDADEGFQRWYVGGAPAADDLDPPALMAAQADDRPLMPMPQAPAPAPRRMEGWVAAVGSIAALGMLWGFYGVVDDAVVRAAHRQLQPAETTTDVARAGQLPATPAEGSRQDADRMHAVYELPAAGATLHYTRWP